MIAGDLIDNVVRDEYKADAHVRAIIRDSWWHVHRDEELPTDCPVVVYVRAIDMVEDGFGSMASAVCPICRCRAVYVCRPGDIRCGVCYDNNPREWYTGTECPHCYMNAVHNGTCVCCKDCDCGGKNEL